MEMTVVATIAGSAAGIVVALVGGVYKLNKDIYSSSDNVRKELNASFQESIKQSREDRVIFEERMAVNDQRWSALFSQYHDFDKQLAKFSSCEKVKVCK